MNVCELFARVGGFHLGLKDSSDEFDFVWANQWEPGKKVQHAYDCYVKLFGEVDFHVNEDIVDISDNFKFEFENSDIMSNGTIYTEKTVPKYDGKFILLRDILESDVDEKYHIDTDESILEKWKAPKAAKRINLIELVKQVMNMYLVKDY